MKRLLLLSSALSLLAFSVYGDTTIAVTPGSGATIVATDDGSGNLLPHNITCDRTTPTQCIAINSSGAVATQLPATAATSAKQDTGNTSLSTIATWTGSAISVATHAVTQSGTWTVQPGNTANTTAWKVDGSAVTQPVSLAGTQSVNAAQLAGTTTDTNSGSKSAGTLRVVIATDQPALSNKLLVTPDSVALPANQSVNLSQVGGTTVVNGGVAGSQAVGGTVATNVAITANPLNLGAQAVSSENSAATTARQVQLVADLVGKLIVLPYANPENFVSGVISSAMTGTTSTSLVAAPASGLRNYITSCIASNSHATVGTDILLQDGSGGTTLAVLPAAPAFGGASISFPTPLRQPTTATALYAANVTTGANTKISCFGYKGA